MAKLGEGERQVRLGQDRLAIKRKRAESIYIVLPTPIFPSAEIFTKFSIRLTRQPLGVFW